MLRSRNPIRGPRSHQDVAQGPGLRWSRCATGSADLPQLRPGSRPCGGGEPSDVFEFMHHYGLPDETCVPYRATDYKKYTETNGMCPPEGYCMNCITTPDHPEGPRRFPVKSVVRYRTTEYGRVSGEHAMMKELLNGPITCGIACSDEFTFNYSAGIFHDKTGVLDIDHDVEIVGWGEEADGTKYWNVRNSWGIYWGMKGFFKIVRGVNNLGIESDCHRVQPDISDEELVFSQTTLLYGGSLWGIVPFAKGAATSYPINTTADVVLTNLPLQSEELPSKTAEIVGHTDEEMPMEIVALRTAEKLLRRKSEKTQVSITRAVGCRYSRCLRHSSPLAW